MFWVITMIYDAMIDTYIYQAEILEQRLKDLKASAQRQDDTYSSRVALLEKEIHYLREIAAKLQERQGNNV